MGRLGSGQLIGGRYRLIEELGEGAAGVVWAAEHIKLLAPVAIKFLHPSLASDEEITTRFLREARTAACLRTLHVVRILDYDTHRAIPFIAMELLHGESLETRLEREGILSAVDTALVLTQVARGVSEAHALGIVHRDLKPENIFLVREGEQVFVKVLDFGVAKIAARAGGKVTNDGGVIGTPYYMSAEQASGRGVDWRSDIWSFGVIAFECITGYLPFGGDTLFRVLQDVRTASPPIPSKVAPVPPGFDPWFAQAVARDKEKRFQSVMEAAVELERLANRGLDRKRPDKCSSLVSGARVRNEVRAIIERAHRRVNEEQARDTMPPSSLDWVIQEEDVLPDSVAYGQNTLTARPWRRRSSVPPSDGHEWEEETARSPAMEPPGDSLSNDGEVSSPRDGDEFPTEPPTQLAGSTESSDGFDRQETESIESGLGSKKTLAE